MQPPPTEGLHADPRAAESSPTLEEVGGHPADHPVDLPTVVVFGHGALRSFDAVFRADHRAVLAIVWALTGDRPVAEELTQEAFLRAHQRWTKVGALDNPGGWVRRVAINLAHSDRRRRGAERRAVARLRPVTDRPDRSADVVGADRFWTAVRSLPRQQGAVIALHYLEDRSVADIATVLGLADGTVKVHLHRARTALATTLSLDPEEDR